MTAVRSFATMDEAAVFVAELLSALAAVAGSYAPPQERQARVRRLLADFELPLRLEVREKPALALVGDE